MSDFIKLPKKQIEENIEDDDTWPIIESFFKEHGFVSHHIDSYNTFIEQDIPKIIEGKIIEVEVDGKKCKVEFVEVFIDHPVHRQLNEEIILIYPKMCIDRDISYLSKIFVKVEVTNQNNSKKIYENILIGEIPVMVKSFLCNLYPYIDDKERLAQLEENFYDPGGYFIINGASKIISNEERTTFNIPCGYGNRKSNPKYDIYVEVRSMSMYNNHSTTTCIGMFHKHKTIGMVIPYIETSEIPLGIIFKALGAKSENEIIRFVFGEKYDEEGIKILLPSLEFSYECQTKESALYYIGKSGKKFTGAYKNPDDIIEDEEEITQLKLNQVKIDAVSYAKHLIEVELLPHIGSSDKSNIEKMFYIGIMVKKLIDIKLKRQEKDDRDHECVKRLLTAGIRMSNLFNNTFKRLCSEIILSIERCIKGNNAVEIKSIIKPNIIKTAMCNAISNNSWGGRGKTPGISQEYDRFNYQALLCNARKDKSPVNTEGGKVEKPRQVHGTHWGNKCMSDTPEGKTAGLVKNKAMGQLVTLGSDHFSILELLKNMNIISFDKYEDPDFFNLSRVFLDGVPIGVTKYAENIRNELLNLRNSLNINYEVSISFNKKLNELHVVTDAGRTYRPLFIVKNGELLLKKHHIEEIKKGYWDEPPGNSWTKLLVGGFVEMIDKQEEEQSLIAMFPSEILSHPRKHSLTHCELHPCLAFGVGVNVIPFPDHNQCIFEDEIVFMTNGTSKKIKDVVTGDIVINFDPNTQKQTNTVIVGNYSNTTTKKIYELVTFSGRKIKATFDHQFMTDGGWTRLEYIFPYVEENSVMNTLVAVSLEQKHFNFLEESTITVPLSQENLKKVFSKVNIGDSDNNYILESYGNELSFDDPYITIRSRILGYALSNKSKILIEDEDVIFSAKFKHNNDAEYFNNDLKLLGYYSSSIISTDNYVLLKNNDLSLIVFLLACGVKVLGRKHYLNIPDFIKHSNNLSVKREFIAGFQGGNSTSIITDTFKYQSVFKFPEILILSPKEFSLHNKEFRDDIISMIKSFGVNVIYSSDISNGNYNDISCFSYNIDSNILENIVEYSDKIGYRYNRYNTLELGLISEYLKSKKINSFSGSFQKWREIVKISPEGYTLFLPIYKKILRDDIKNISDITTLSSYQSFICGDGFCVHNSPRNTYQCIYEEEDVLMDNFTTKKIKDVVVGDKIKSFDPITKNVLTSNVIHIKHQKTTKRILEISTTNTKIILTLDHKIFTPLYGWIESRYLKAGDYVYESGGSILISSEIIYIRTLKDEKYNNVCDISVDLNTQSFICGTSIDFFNSNKKGICVHNSSMGKQSVGIPGSNYMFKTKGTFHVMNYHQKQLISTKMSKIMGFQHQPFGLNTVLFVGPLLGYNQEDSLIMNLDAVERGFMSSTIYIPFDAKNRKDKGELFEVPDEAECSNFCGNISKLDSLTGIVREGETVEEGDILIGKTVSIDEESSIYHKSKKNLSIRYDHKLPGIVHLVQTGIDGQGYDYVRVVIAQERYPIEGDKFCYTPDHDVLTDKGWINITRLTFDHKVATLNASQEIEYHHPTDILMFEHNGEMIEVNTNQVLLCVTPNHKMYVRRNSSNRAVPKDFILEEAKNLHNVHVHYKKNGINTNKGLEYFILPEYTHKKKKGEDIYFPERKLPINEWLIFYGIWYAEGWARIERDTSIDIHKQRVKDALDKILPILNFKYTLHRNDNYIVFANIQLRNYMGPLSVGAINKKLEDWVWDLNEEQSRILLDSMCLGDGHKQGNTQIYDTSSVQLKDDVVRLALHCGWSANACIRELSGTSKIIYIKTTTTNANAWRITIIKKQNEPAVNKHIKGQQRSIEYNGKVYCCTVPNNVLYVRRNLELGKKGCYLVQKPVWSGNSAVSGNKGVICKLVRSHELPFNKYGIAPDMMMNPLALPSRMTIGMMIEILCGKLVCSTSKLHKITVDQVFRLDKKNHPNPEDKISDYNSDIKFDEGDESISKSEYTLTEDETTASIYSDEELFESDCTEKEDYKKFISVYNEKIDDVDIIRGQDATPWQSSFSVEWVCEELKKLGINEFSSERMTYGKSGEVQEYLTYEGICYYQRLKHMVVDKHHSRSRGSRVRLTHQPVEDDFRRY